jgi:hypothetical protein
MVRDKLNESVKKIYGQSSHTPQIIDEQWIEACRKKRGEKLSRASESKDVPSVMPGIRIKKIPATTMLDTVKKSLSAVDWSENNPNVNLKPDPVPDPVLSTKEPVTAEVPKEQNDNHKPEMNDEVKEEIIPTQTSTESEAVPVSVSAPSISIPKVESTPIPDNFPTATLHALLQSNPALKDAWSSLNSNEERKGSPDSDRKTDRKTDRTMSGTSSKKARALSTPKPIKSKSVDSRSVSRHKSKSRKQREPEPESEQSPSSSDYDEKQSENEDSDHSGSGSASEQDDLDSQSEEQTDSETDQSEQEHIREESRRRRMERQERKRNHSPIELNGEIDSSAEDITTLSRRMRWQQGLSSETVREVRTLKLDMEEIITGLNDAHGEVYDLATRVEDLTTFVQTLTMRLEKAGILEPERKVRSESRGEGRSGSKGGNRTHTQSKSKTGRR